MIYTVLNMPGGAGFLQSTVSLFYVPRPKGIAGKQKQQKTVGDYQWQYICDHRIGTSNKVVENTKTHTTTGFAIIT